MITIILQIAGVFGFIAGTIILGNRVNNYPIIEVAERSSRKSHLLFYFFLILPGTVGFFYPGLTHYDEVIGFPSLPFQTIGVIVGAVIFLIGFYYTALSNKSLAKIGKGAAAFNLTKQLVDNSVYNQTRNPMSLGYYLICLGVGLLASSTYLILGTLFVLVPAHLFNLNYFEMKELEIRFGQFYNNYKKDVPFIIPRLNLSINKVNRGVIRKYFTSRFKKGK